MKVIIGLGNPGRQYEFTRHNVGFMAIDHLSEMYGIDVIKSKHKALVGDKNINGEKLMLAKPMTYMNLSGESIREILNFYKLTVDDIIVIYDDTSLPVGSIRIRENGSDGGHNGMKSIISHLGTQNFVRVRIGIGDKPPGWVLADYVLSKFFEEERAELEKSIKDAGACVKLIIDKSVKDAMNKYNKKTPKPKSNEEKMQIVEASMEKAKKSSTGKVDKADKTDETNPQGEKT